MIPPKALSIVLLFIILCTQGLPAQAVSTKEAVSSNKYEKEKPEFPRWVRDLRRAEIIAFGSFPFMMFLSNFSVDSYRASNHDWDSRYMPWPFKGAGAVDMTTDEHVLTLSAAIVGSLAIALADHLIFRFKREKAERREQQLPEGDLIILRKPWPLEDTPAGGEAASPDKAPSTP
ncbi:hypothetical protein [Treponema primitia]|uniref:hypothetical protein n=1 Tax=Treponema primitia TaxID=88058 RepID=UPI0002555081|nr:hypothetical protein [Treponema primitia]